MLFNSIDFAVFLPIVFVLYWFVFKDSIRKQNILLVIASSIFYGWWDWRFLLLIFFSTIVDFVLGIKLQKTTALSYRKGLLWVSIIVNLGLLGFFKYFNFFIDNFEYAFSLFGAEFTSSSLNIILPVGISFYTFQTLSYTIDVYRKKIDATHDFISFAAFVSFFPQLVAGPIERATNLLPQFGKRRVFTYRNAVDGGRQILWGLVKKIIVADNCAQYANMIFDNSADYSGSTLVMGALFFTFQIYGDFSGYSDIAIGTARLFGFNLMQNFAYPYFSRDVAEFWRRWHISLSTWFRDYLYIPLGGSKGTTFNKIRNTFIIFLVSGFWHGANWTFIIWGLLNAIYFLPLLLRNKNRKHLTVVAEHRWLPSIVELFQMLFTFSLTMFAWIFFRAENLGHAISYITSMLTPAIFAAPEVAPTAILVLLCIVIVIEWMARHRRHAFANLELHLNKPARWGCYLYFTLAIYFFGKFSDEIEFIYFQF